VRGYLFVGTAAALWGTIGIAARPILASGMTALDAATWRAAGAFVLLLAYALIVRRRALRVARSDLWLFASYGVVSVAGFMTVYFVAIQLTTVATAVVLLYTAPAWVVLMARMFFAEPIGPSKATAVVLVFLGCVLVVGGFGAGAVRLSPAGLVAGLAAGITYALYSIFGKTALRRYSPLTTLVYALGFGALCLMGVAGGIPRLPPDALLAVAYTIVFPTMLAYVLYTNGLRAIEAGQASVIATIEPVVAAVGGALLLREPFALAQWAGALLVIAGVLVVRGEPQKDSGVSV
jgi:drug/metabolite transporter (DMT)-like permease